MNDTLATFEKLLAKSGEGKYVLRLYVTGNTALSAQAVENVRKICDTWLKGRYELSIIDLFQTPDAARDGQVICAPTLVKELPPPLRRLIGDLSDTRRVLLALDLKSEIT